VPVYVQPASRARLGGVVFPIWALKNVKWLRSRMRQYQSTMNDIRKVIGEIGFEFGKNLDAKGA
jgi:hypothetical protein